MRWWRVSTVPAEGDARTPSFSKTRIFSSRTFSACSSASSCPSSDSRARMSAAIASRWCWRDSRPAAGETPSLTRRPMRRSSEATAANCALSFSISCRRVRSRAWTCAICRSMSEASSERPGSSIRATSWPRRDRFALFRDARRQAALARERERQALFLGDGEQADGLARVVLMTNELPVAPRPGQSDSHRQDDPEDFFHRPPRIPPNGAGGVKGGGVREPDPAPRRAPARRGRGPSRRARRGRGRRSPTPAWRPD